MRSIRRIITLGAAALGLAGVVAMAVGQAPGDPPAPPSLKTVVVPEPPNLGEFVRDRQAALRLGKALFWDMQVGSDGRTACATCHFSAGADNRSINQLNPGTLARDLFGRVTPDTVIDRGANSALTADMFPLRVLSNPHDRASGVVRDSNDVVGSQGTFNAIFQRAVPGQPEEVVSRPPDPVFRVGSFNVRQVTPRHAPSVINAVFNHRNGWDGAAQNEFNGLNQWGDRDANARVLRVISPRVPVRTNTEDDDDDDDDEDDRDEIAFVGGEMALVKVRLINSSLASQSVAPIINNKEMSADGRIAADIGNKLGKASGKKLSQIRPLGRQLVHREDSVLGPFSRGGDPGLTFASYDVMVQQAFQTQWWQSDQVIQVGSDGKLVIIPNPGRALADNEYTMMEYNFPLFFGLALQMYQATLVSNDAPYDRWREGRATLSPQALLGLQVFLGQQARLLSDGTRRAGARCINCHAGPEFTDASVGSIASLGPIRLREGQDLDRGFNNIGLRPWRDDIGVGGRDPWGKWLSVTRNSTPSGRTIAVDGAVKVPGLRNIELTAPYFRNGGYHTLESVVQFYSRGGDFAPLTGMDNMTIQPLSVPVMSPEEQAGMVAFLRSLTDERVRLRRAPFDHPQLFIPHGQIENNQWVLPDPLRWGQAIDRMREIPAVGRNGGAALAGFMQFR